MYLLNREDKASAAAKKKSGMAKAAETSTTEDLPEDDTDTQSIASAYNGADEDEVIDQIYGNYSKESFNAAGQPSGEKVVFKEDAQKAGKEIIETLKGVKGKKLAKYMKEHFNDTWGSYDVNGDGSITLEESHTF